MMRNPLPPGARRSLAPTAHAAEQLPCVEHRHNFYKRDWPRAGWLCQCGMFEGDEEKARRKPDAQ